MKDPADSAVPTRRDALKMMSGAVLAASATGVAAAAAASSAQFYKDGAFDPEAAKAAYFKVMEKFGYPIPDVLRTDEFWVCDFLQADFSKVGMGGIFWINEKGNYGENGGGKYAGEFKKRDFGYLGHEIYLLPGQMLPEHYHIGGAEGYGPKMEARIGRGRPGIHRPASAPGPVRRRPSRGCRQDVRAESASVAGSSVRRARSRACAAVVVRRGRQRARRAR